MLAQHLDHLTEQFPQCNIAAFADIGTGITLVTSSGTDVSREILDELCAEAALTLGTPDEPTLGTAPCSLVIKSLDSVVLIYMRAAQDPSDALLCMCRSEVDLDAFIIAARACIDGTA